MAKKNINKLILTILDGWGYSEEHKEFNAVEGGNTVNWHSILQNNPSCNLITFGEEVGLPEGQMGNSEVGHTNIGAGRVVYQELPRINKAIKNLELEQNPKIIEVIKNLRQSKKRMHIMGLYSNGGVHSSIEHLLYSAELFAKQAVEVILHLFTDGRDTPPQSAKNFNKALDDMLLKYPNIKLGTVSGRYYAMDRDKRWDRVELVYNAIVMGKGDQKFSSFSEVIEDSYKNSVNDEFIKPAVINGYKPIEDSDSIFMVNFRTDRAREILEALLFKDFTGFKREKIINFAKSLGMVAYSDSLRKELEIVFEPFDLNNTLGEWLSKNNYSQLRVAETEKYPHVTFFFSGGREEPFPGEERILIPSPKVATYDLKPEMSAYEITEDLIEHMAKNDPDFIVVNYSNGDMVGHTGVLSAALKATEAVDICLAKLEQAVKKYNYIWLIIADHGNCETMWDFKNQVPHTQHTTNLVKAVLCNQQGELRPLYNGKLADVAPTILELMNIEIPTEMNGRSLFKK